MAVARVGVAEAQADQLAVEQAAVGQEHVGQEAAVPVSRAAGGQLQAHGVAFAGTAGEGGRLGAEVLHALLGMPGLGRVDAPEADPGVPAAPVGRVDVQRVAVDHANDAERLAVIAPVVVARRRRAKAEEACPVRDDDQRDDHQRNGRPPRLPRRDAQAPAATAQLGLRRLHPTGPALARAR